MPKPVPNAFDRCVAFARNSSIARVIVGVNLLILLMFGLTATIFLMGFNENKVSGPIYDRIKNANDLTADILPPPL